MVNSINKATNILSVIADGQNLPVTLSEISEKTGLPKPTCVRMLQTLCESGYARQVSRTKGYVLGAALYYLTRYEKSDNSLPLICRPMIKWLGRKTDLTVVLAIIQNNAKYIVDHVDSDILKFPRASIIEDDIYRTSTGRVILANMERDVLQKLYNTIGPPSESDWPGVSSYDRLCYELDIIREKNMVMRVGNSEMVGYAVGIFGNSKCVGAIGIVADPADMQKKPQKEKEILKYLKLAASKITDTLSN